MLRLGLAAGIAVLVALCCALERAPLELAALYLVMGTISVFVYRHDKQAARDGAWRVPEATLQGIDLVGGIAGGFVAQEVLRHKTRKEPFRTVSLLTAGLHLLALGSLLAGIWAFPIA